MSPSRRQNSDSKKSASKATQLAYQLAWKRRMDEQPLLESSQRKVTLNLLREMLPSIIRIFKYKRQEEKRGRLPVMDPNQGFMVAPEMGVPMGGLGGGTITRGCHGDFNRWQLQAGMVEYNTVLADQFSLWVERPGQDAQAVVLNPAKPSGSSLSAWNWGFPSKQATYRALYPRAWTEYDQVIPGIRLTCRQVSPVIPHNYHESSTPAGVFAWTIENTGSTDMDVAVMFTFQNSMGNDNDLAGGHSNHLVRQREKNGEFVAIELRHIHRQPKPLEDGQKLSEQTNFEDPLTFAIAAQATEDVQITYNTRFVSNSSGRDVWDQFSVNGHLGNYSSEKTSTEGMAIGAALAARVRVPAGEQREVVFVLAWDMPVARFGSGSGWYRRYTRFYGRNGDAAARIARDALLNYPKWEKQIDAWQQPVLADPDLPEWYKALLFNETYYLADGGTIWTAGRESVAGKENNKDPQDTLPEPEIGHFAYLESYEYRMYNTYDVHFYSSFALAMLWPELELSLQYDYIHSINVEHPEMQIMWSTGQKTPRKVRNMIPHDLGSPIAAPWEKVNAYLYQDVSRWKDLNSKFVLMVYRDYVLTQNKKFLEDAWTACQQAIDKLQQFDRDGDGLIENDGFPDQTYDTWTASGASAYTGGLWLACLSAMQAIAQMLGKNEEASSYQKKLDQAQHSYEEKLWNGEYYYYDSGGLVRKSRHFDSIMADQLAGQWYARACNLPDVIPPDHARLALQKIFDFNVMQFEEGEAGAINGMRPDGSIDRSSMQANEMWIGTTFALAGCMLQEGLKEQAFKTAAGAFLSVYRDYGLFFQTPESINDEGVYRAIGYMRPLSVWAIQWAWERSRHKAQND